jgi:hypothetical protein
MDAGSRVGSSDSNNGPSAGLPDFSCYKMPKRGKIYQITTNFTKRPWYIAQDRNMDQVSIKYTIIFHCKTLQNLPKFGFLVWKQTIWQPWPSVIKTIRQWVPTWQYSSPCLTEGRGVGVPDRFWGFFERALQTSSLAQARVARCYIFIPKLPILVYFWRPWNEQFRYSFWSFRTLCGYLVNF